MQARSSTVLANIRRAQGRKTEELELRNSALKFATELGSRKDIIGARMNLAILEKSLGLWAEAAKNFEQVLPLVKDIGDKQQLAQLQLNWASLLYNEGDNAGALKKYEEARRVSEETGDNVRMARCLRNIAVVLFQMGNLEEARNSILPALRIAQESRLPDDEAEALSVSGDLSLAGNDLEGARKAYEDAQKIYARTKDDSNRSRSELPLASLAVEEGHARDAEAMLRPLIEEFSRDGLQDDEREARVRLVQALMAEGRLKEAAHEIEMVKSKPEDPAVRVSWQIARAELKASGENSDDASHTLQEALDAVKGMKGAVLELRLFQAGSEKDRVVASRLAGALAEDATREGFLLIAAKAAKIHTRGAPR